jgi:protein-tyrosine phosphatase
MDKSNYQNVISLTDNENHRSKVKLILTEKYEDEIKEVPDPYFGMENGFDLVYEMLDTTCELIASKLKMLHSKK